MTLVRTLVVLLAAVWAFGGPPAAARDASPVELATARFAVGAAAHPPAGGATVALPHAWEATNPDASGEAWYVIDWNVDTPSSAQALYLTAITVAANVYVNGELVAQVATFGLRGPRSYEQSQLIRMPADLVRRGTNTLALHVWTASPLAAGLGPIAAGSIVALRERWRADFFQRTLGPAAVSVATFTVGIFIVALWLRRRDAAYALFGFAAMLWSLHTLVSLLPDPLLPQPHWRIVWHTAYMAFVALLCLFCVRFAGVRWYGYRRFVVAYAGAVLPVLYAANAFDALNDAESLVRLGGIAIVFVALAAVGRYAARNRNIESALLLAAGGISTAFAVHDWLAALDPQALRPVWLVPYAALAFLTLVGYILVDRFVRALNESERLNIDLERRVAEKGAALSAQLEATQAARDDAEAASRSKSRFLAAASHDLRQPLHALGMFSHAMAEHVQDADGHALAQRITTSVSALEALFSALLDVSKLDAGVIAAQPVDMPIRPLLDRLTDEFASEALERGLKLAVVSGDVVVRSDPMLLERIIRNLVANALRYTERGGVVIGCRRRGAQYAIEVWDSGPGIAAAERERIFEEFYQVGNPARDRARGLGLGLAIVRRLADLLGHRIDVASREGRGSVFRVVVPAGDRTALARPAPAVVQDAMDGRRVLVIDDEADVRDGTVRLLSQWGCDAIAIAGADEARSACAERGAPEAMIVDYRLGNGTDGLDAIAALRAQFGRTIPAVLVSGESGAVELARIQAGGIALLHKPLPPARLRSTLAHLLAPNAATDERQPACAAGRIARSIARSQPPFDELAHGTNRQRDQRAYRPFGADKAPSRTPTLNDGT